MSGITTTGLSLANFFFNVYNEINPALVTRVLSNDIKKSGSNTLASLPKNTAEKEKEKKNTDNGKALALHANAKKVT